MQNFPLLRNETVRACARPREYAVRAAWSTRAENRCSGVRYATGAVFSR
jgi:hypothetical protein